MLGFLYLTFLNFNKVMSIERIGAFDPYEILEVDTDATMKQIKSRYRKLSLTKHPDKNPDDPLAVQEFIRLTKAYRVSKVVFLTRPFNCADFN
jgi:DnaJ-class molecular chaperone